MSHNTVTTILLTSALTCCCARSAAQSGWYQQNPLPTGNTLNAVSFTDAKTGTAVGEYGTIIRTTNGGSTWKEQTSGTTAPLFSVSFTDANTGTAVGGNNFSREVGGGRPVSAAHGIPIQGTVRETQQEDPCIILRTTDGGVTWTRQWSLAAKALFSVSFFDPNKGIAVGDSGTIVRTTDGGTTWTSQQAGTAEPLNSVSFNDSLNAWAVGGEFRPWWGRGSISSSRIILHSSDGGVSWIVQDFGSVVGQDWPLKSAFFVDPYTGVVVGQNGTILHTYNGGLSWNVQTSGTTANLCGVSFADRKTGIAVGDGGIILSTTDGGTTWASQASGTTSSLAGVSFFKAKTGTAVGYHGTILRTTNGGTSWTNQESRVTSATLYSVSFSDARTGTAVGMKITDIPGWGRPDAVIIRTTDGGTTWTNQGGMEATWLHGVSFSDANNGTAVGWYYAGEQHWDMGGVILRTTNGGSTWVSQATVADRLFQAVCFTDANNGTVVGGNQNGQGGVILRTTNGGATWIDKTGTKRVELNAVSFSDPQTGTAVGFGGAILRTTNGGLSWNIQESGTTADLWGVSFTSPSKGTATGNFGTILRTTNGGTTWFAQTSGTSSNLQGLSFTDSSNGTAAGWYSNDGPATSTIIRTTDGGITWTSQWSESRVTLRAVSSSSREVSTAVGYVESSASPFMPLILRTTDGGASWTKQFGPPSAGIYEGVSFFDSQNGYIVGAGTGTSAAILSTHDGGATWKMDYFPFGLTGITCTGPRSAFAVGTDWNVYKGVIVRTTDGGGSWTSQEPGTQWYLQGVSFCDPTNGIVVGSFGTVLHTTDAGATWTDLSKMENFDAVSFTDANTGWITAGGTVFRTTDGGDTWIPQRSRPRDALQSLFFTDRSTGTAVGTSYDSLGNVYPLILRTTDGGNTWSNQSSGTADYLSAVAFTDVLTGTAIGGSTILRTTDGGATWAVQLSEPPLSLLALSLSGGNTGTVVGSDGIILRTTTGGIDWVQSDRVGAGAIPRGYVLEQNYPNPFNPTTKIQFSIANRQLIIVKVFDVLGREVTTLVNEVKDPGTYTVRFDARLPGRQASLLSSGVYFYRLQAGDFIATKKMLVLK